MSPWPGHDVRPYRTRWYSPYSFLDDALVTTPPTKHCDGVADPACEAASSVSTALRCRRHRLECRRRYSRELRHVRAGHLLQRRRVQALERAPTTGRTIDLRHVGSRRNVGGLSLGVTASRPGKGDLGKGDPGDLGKGDLGKGDLGKGDLGKGDLGKGDLGKGDLGKGDLGTPDRAPEVTSTSTPRDTSGMRRTCWCRSSASSPSAVQWTPPHVDKPTMSHAITSSRIGRR